MILVQVGECDIPSAEFTSHNLPVNLWVFQLFLYGKQLKHDFNFNYKFDEHVVFLNAIDDRVLIHCGTLNQCVQ